MGINFYFSQIFGIIALAIVCISYQFNSKAKFLALQILANTFYASSFLALNVLVGGINTIISLFRVTILFLFERKDKSPPICLYILFFLLYIASGIICWQSPLDIISIITFEIFNVAMFIRNITLTRWMMIFPNLLIAIYNLLLMTYTNAILDCVEVCVLIISIIKFSKSRTLKKIKYLL